MKCELEFKYIKGLEKYELGLLIGSEKSNLQTHDVAREYYNVDYKDKKSDIGCLRVLSFELFMMDVVGLFERAFSCFDSNKDELNNFSIELTCSSFSTNIEQSPSIDLGLEMICKWIEMDFYIFKNKVIK